MKVTISQGLLGLDEIAEAMGGELILRGIEQIPRVRCVCTDSREADGDTLFCAIRGERVDGHRYVSAAGRLGCSAFLCDHIPDGLPPVCGVVLVKETVPALAHLSSVYRKKFLPHITPVAVTGSVGKTTTKECIAAVLSKGKALFKKEGNYNSVIGLPLSVLEIGKEQNCAVLEMGMSGFGEISAMSQAVNPHIGVITNIGSSHLELLGSRDNIAKAKLEIVCGMGEGDLLLVNGDEPLLNGNACISAREKGIEVLRLSLEDTTADFHVDAIRPRDAGMAFSLKTPQGKWENLFIPAVGNHMVTAAAFAAAVGSLMHLSETDVRAGLAEYQPAGMRQNVYTAGQVTVIEDCYNAAPESMRAALSVLSLTAKGRMIAVLGDMKELGEGSVDLHRAVGQYAAEVFEGRELYLVTIGMLGKEIAQGAAEAGFSAEHIYVGTDDTPYTETSAYLRSILRPHDTILFKASRAMALEQIIQNLKNTEKGQ